MRKNILNKVMITFVISVSGIALLSAARAETVDGGVSNEVVVTGKKPVVPQFNFAGSSANVGSGLAANALSAANNAGYAPVTQDDIYSSDGVTITGRAPKYQANFAGAATNVGNGLSPKALAAVNNSGYAAVTQADIDENDGVTITGRAPKYQANFAGASPDIGNGLSPEALAALNGSGASDMGELSERNLYALGLEGGAGNASGEYEPGEADFDGSSLGGPLPEGNSIGNVQVPTGPTNFAGASPDIGNGLSPEALAALNGSGASDMGELSERNLYALGLEGGAGNASGEYEPGEADFDGSSLGGPLPEGNSIGNVQVPTGPTNFAGSLTDVGNGLSDDAMAALNGSTLTMTTTTEKNGEVNKEVENKEVMGAAGTYEGSASNQKGDNKEGDAAQAESDAQKASEDAKKEEEKKEEEKKDEEDYNGLYNGFHIIPDIMAQHCKIKGEEVAKDPELFVDCIKQYVSEMNNSNATAKAEAEKEYELLRYKLLVDDGATAITKAQVVDNHTDTMNKQVEAHEEMKTESDDNKSLTASLSFVTNVMNDIRELQVENLKYMVVSGIGQIDPSIIMEEEEEKDEKKDEKSSANNNAAPEINKVNVEAKIEPNSK